MVNFGKIFALAMVGSASAVHINFKRYADDKCDAAHHIRKTSDLHGNHCKTFSHHELGFHSFEFEITKHAADVRNKDCRVIVYADRDCKGEAITYGDMGAINKQCAAIPIEGRSVRVECHPKPSKETKTLTPTPKPVTTKKQQPTVTVTHHHFDMPEKIMTVVPKQRVQHCQFDPYDYDYEELQ